MALSESIDKIWFLGRNHRSPTGAPQIVIIDRRTSEELLLKDLPTGGDWDREGFINCRRFTVDGTEIAEERLDFIDIQMRQTKGEWSGQHVAVWLTKSSSHCPVSLWHCDTTALAAGQHFALLKGIPNRVAKLKRIEILAETSSRQEGWFYGGSPNQFMFVVATEERGLLLSEILPFCNPGQRMEKSETALFPFVLPVPLTCSELMCSGKMFIKAKGVDSWSPRHILVLGVFDAPSEYIQLLGGRLNIDDIRLTTRSREGDCSLLEIPFWVA